MRIEDREEYIDLVAQAVIDRLEERDHIAGLVNAVVNRVIELQQAKTEQDRADQADDPDEQNPTIHEENTNAPE